MAPRELTSSYVSHEDEQQILVGFYGGGFATCLLKKGTHGSGEHQPNGIGENDSSKVDIHAMQTSQIDDIEFPTEPRCEARTKRPVPAQASRRKPMFANKKKNTKSRRPQASNPRPKRQVKEHTNVSPPPSTHPKDASHRRARLRATRRNSSGLSCSSANSERPAPWKAGVSRHCPPAPPEK